MSLETVIIESRDSFYQYLEEHRISKKKFNQPVVIADGVTDCEKLFLKFRGRSPKEIRKIVRMVLYGK